MPVLTFTIPVRTQSEANLRQHWRVRAKRAKAQRKTAYLYASQMIAKATILKEIPLVITITRVAPRKLDSDNLAGAGKFLRDGIADALERDDGDEAIEWVYRQRKGRPGEYGVDVVIIG